MPTDPADEPREEALTVLEQLLTAARAYYDAYGNCGSQHQQSAADKLQAAMQKAAAHVTAPASSRLLRETRSIDDLLLELRECAAAMDAVIQQRPMLAAMRAGSTTLGNRLAEAKATIARAAHETRAPLDLKQIAGALEPLLFDFLRRKYVQRQDARHKEMNLQYTTAETHDLAAELSRFILAQAQRPHTAPEALRIEHRATLDQDEPADLQEFAPRM
jgi:hypothetical protein